MFCRRGGICEIILKDDDCLWGGYEGMGYIYKGMVLGYLDFEFRVVGVEVIW